MHFDTDIYRYGRILQRIGKSHSAEQLDARKILSWIACAKVPLQRREISEALMVREGDTDIVYERKTLQDFRRLCGPIIELDGDTVRFVHFTAKE